MAVPVADEAQPPPWDVGLQNERTSLAWQRTVLSGLTWGLLVTRLLADVSLTLAIVSGVLALGTSAAFGGTALQRFRSEARALAVGGPLGDARPAALAVLLLLLTGVGAATYVLLA